MKAITRKTLVASVFALAPFVAQAETAVPKMSPGQATLIGKMNLATVAASKTNEEALAALRNAKPVAPRPRLLPNGKPAAARSFDSAALLRAGANTRVASAGLTSISGFTGITEGVNAAANGYELEPPDQGMTVANGVVGEVVNNTLQFFQSGQPLSAPVATSAFFNSGSVASLSDPHITYDPSVQRWFVDELTYNGPLGYGFYLAVSTTSNPLGSYNVYFLPSFSSDLAGCGSSGCLPDYPQVGYDANGFYITADLFGPSSFVAAAIYAFPKVDLVEGRSFTYPRFALQDFVVQPVVPAPNVPFSLANGGTEYFVTARNIFDNSTTIRVWEVQNTFNLAISPGTLTAVSYDMTGESYTSTVPSTEPNDVGPYGKSLGATTSPLLDGGYNSFTANGKLVYNSRIFAALTTGSVDSNGLARDIVAWFQIGVGGAKPKLVTQGYIVPPTGYSISYPGLALNIAGNGYIGMTITNPNKKVVGGYPSTAVVPFTHGTVGAITVTGVGGASDDGFTGYGGPGPAGVGRWGDYASAVVDPVTGIFYTANEFIPDPNVYTRGTFANWGTFITAIHQ
jgi:hypothetical protein